MDSLCSGWKKKQALHEYQRQFSNEKNLFDTRKWSFQIQVLQVSTSCYFFIKKTVFKSLLCYRLGTLIFQTLKCHLGSSLNIVSSACSSKACYNLEK